jgi:hypothetical protein
LDEDHGVGIRPFGADESASAWCSFMRALEALVLFVMLERVRCASSR